MSDQQLPNNFVYLHGYLKKAYLYDKVGHLKISIPEKDQTGKERETFLDVTCFGKALEYAKKLKDNQYLTIKGRQSRREHQGVWKQETIANILTPMDKFHQSIKPDPARFDDVPF